MTASIIKTKPLSQPASDRSIKRIKELLLEGLSQSDIVATLNSEGYRTIRLQLWTTTNLKQIIFKLRHDLKSWYHLSARRAGLVVAQMGAAQ